MRRRGALGALALAAALALAGCTTASGGLLDDYQQGDAGGDYISGDGTVFVPQTRGEPVSFAGVTATGEQFTTASHAGEVLVVNFWYADCPPCRIEAPDLQQLHERYLEQGVRFVGVNVRDDAARALSFESEFGIDYPSILDAESNEVQLAFAGQVAPNAVPTTLVLDRQGRVAARISGLVSDPALLAQFLDDALAEAP